MCDRITCATTSGIALSEAGNDLSDIPPPMGHKRLETTRRHYVPPVLDSRIQAVSRSIEGRLGWKPKAATAELRQKDKR